MNSKNDIVFNTDFFTVKIRKDLDAVTLLALIPIKKAAVKIEHLNIEDFIVPETGEKIVITRIGRRCFKHGSAPVFINKLTVGTSVTQITHAAFDSANIKVVVWPSNCYSIPKKCFANSSVEQVLNIEHVKYIGKGAFRCCTLLKTFQWPIECKTIPFETFLSCTSLTEVNETQGVESVEESAFANTINLGRIDMSSAIQIQNNAFLCSGVFQIKLSNNLTSIGEKAFRSSSLLSISIPDSVSYVGKEAFKECRSLEFVKWSNSCDVINSSTFNKCTELTSIVGIERVSKICSFAFASSGIADFTIPNKVKVLEQGVFSECRNLAYIHNVHNIDIIEAYAFSMSSLVEMAFPSCQIGEGVLQGCISLRKVYFTGEEIVIPKYFCQGCIHLKEVSGYENIVGIKEAAFSHTDIRNMDFSGASLDFVERYAFEGVEEINFKPSFWTEISSLAFS